MAAVLLLASSAVRGANILWVSDAPPAGFSGPGTNFTDQGFVTLLQRVGHNVNRYNGPDSQNTLLTQAELDAMNTNDLIIIGRAAASAAWQNPQGAQWNTNVLRPLICMSPYLVRNVGNRMSWFVGDVGPDDTPVPWTPGNAVEPTTDYIFSGVPMAGTNMADLYEEPMDRNSSHLLVAPVSGAVIIATATFPREDTAAIATGNAIVGFPAGTAVRAGADILPAYRMFFAAGTRESATAPNGIPFYTGRENLTPAGESVFLRAVAVALNNGVAPTTNLGPITIVTQPTNLTVLQGKGAALSIRVTGAAPRLLQWQRVSNDGVTFTNIPDAFSAFVAGSYRLPTTVRPDDNGAQFRVIASNAFNVVTSDVAVLTVAADTVAPVPLWASSLDGNTITVAFDELLDIATATEPLYYTLNNGNGPDIATITMGADGKSVILSLTAQFVGKAEVGIDRTADIYGNNSTTHYSVIATNFALVGVDVGALNPPGTNAPAGSNSVQVTGGGLDMASTADILRFLYKQVSGDFDAKVQVAAFTGTSDHFETTAKAALVARETTANNSTAVNVFVTPSYPGDETVSSNYRATTGAATNTLGATFYPSGLPNAWMRIRRVGNDFTTYHSSNGVDWISFGTVTTGFGTTMNVGLGVVSHRNGKSATATFSNFSIRPPAFPVLLTNISLVSGTFSSSFPTVPVVVYTVQFKTDITGTTWSSLTNIVGDGSIKTFFDPLGGNSRRFYRVSAQ